MSLQQLNTRFTSDMNSLTSSAKVNFVDVALLSAYNNLNKLFYTAATEDEINSANLLIHNLELARKNSENMLQLTGSVSALNSKPINTFNTLTIGVWPDKAIKFDPVKTVWNTGHCLKVNSFTSSTAIDSSNHVIIANNGITITLPSTPIDGQHYKFHNRDAFQNLTLSGAGKNIDGGSTYVITLPNVKVDVVYSSALDEWFTI